MYGIKEEIVSCILVVGGTHIKDVWCMVEVSNSTS